MKLINHSVGLFVACVLSFAAMAQNDPDKPNIILIMCDDLNDYQGVFGGHPQAKTPHIDQLAASGTKFLNAQSNVPVCQPSRNCMFTGVYPHDSKDFGWTPVTEQAVLKHNKTIMELFNENGYLTLGSGKLLHGNDISMWQEWGENLSFNYGPFAYNGTENVAQVNVPSPFREIGPIDGSFGRFSEKTSHGWNSGWGRSEFRYENDNDRDLTPDEKHAKFAQDKLKEFERNGLDKPFFMGIGFVRPHTPMHAPDKYFEMFPLDEIVLDDWIENDKDDTFYRNNFSATEKGIDYYEKLTESYGDRELAMKKFVQAYLACVAFVDEQIGKVVQALEDSPYADNTIVILTSDHGFHMGEKSYLFKNSPWEESARVPLIIHVPNMQEGTLVEHPVSLVDLFPTMQDYCRLAGDHKKNAKGAKLGGFSLRPFVENPNTSDWEGPDAALTVVGNFGINVPTRQQNYSLRTKDFRYIHYNDGNEELYDHRNDPYEWTNLTNHADYAVKNEELKAKLFERLPDEMDEAFFEDDFEDYNVGDDLTSEGYRIWGNGATLTISNSQAGAAHSGAQYAITNAGWGAFVRNFNLTAGKTYTWTISSKIDETNASRRVRFMQASSVDDFVYQKTDIDTNSDDWLTQSITFTVQEGYENVTLNLTSSTSAQLAVDDFLLQEVKTPVLKIADDGQIWEGEEGGEQISVRLQNANFAQTVNLANWTVENLPQGVSVSALHRISDTRVMMELAGNATASYNKTDITDLSITVSSDELVGSDNELSVRTGVTFRAKIGALPVINAETAFSVYPNPNFGEFQILMPDRNEGLLEVFELSGKKVYQRRIQNAKTEIGLPTGVHGILILRLSQAGKSFVRKIQVMPQ